ncbi:MAG TPA: hypothetical protein VGY30_01510 [Solirubrobacteraceae bacterium]|jgi:hypothetical protein|nr:hypothetical protein [Solirubrobacteraceae bacterium]
MRSLFTLGALCAVLLVGSASAFAVAPIVTKPGNTPLGQGEVGIGAYVTPGGLAISDCRFDYGPTESYGSSAACEPTPPANDEPDLVKTKISGLTPGATYHYRLSVTNETGTTSSEDGIFKVLDAPSQESCPNAGALGAAQLPDCRAWEVVSPSNKNGGDVGGQTGRTRAAADGSALQFSSLAGFAGTGGSSVSTEYIAQRSSNPNPGDNGWETHGITALQEPVSFVAAAAGQEPRYRGDLSSSLDSGVFSAYSPLTNDPNVANTFNLYVRHDLLMPGAGSYQLVTACPFCQETKTPLSALPGSIAFFTQLEAPYLAGASPDFGNVIFQSRYALTADAPEQPASCGFQSFGVFTCNNRLYEWDHGTLRLAGILPDGTAAYASIAGAGARQNNFLTPHTVSDGSDGHTRVFFTWPTNDGITTTPETGSAEASAGNLYMRVDHTTTIQLNESERSEPSNYAPAEYLDASANGERIFFSSKQALTDDAEEGNKNLYMYDASKPAFDPHKLTLLNRGTRGYAGVEAVIGASADGHYVYFADHYRLLNGEPENGIYLWHDGSLTKVGPVDIEEHLGLGDNWGQNPRHARVTPDGRHLLYTEVEGEGMLSAYGGVDYDQSACGQSFNGCRELYVYSADTNSLQCASCNPSGGSAPPLGRDAMASDVNLAVRSGGTAGNLYDNHALSDDGRYVFFSTGERLVPADTNGQIDAYVYDTVTGQPHLLSSGESSTGSYFLDASGNGRDAFFMTQEQLSRWDVDGLYDVYDARVEGGFPEPPLPPPSCQGDACQPPPIQLNDATPSSASFTGAGNQSAAPEPYKLKSRVHRAKKHHKRTVKRGAKHKRTVKHKRRTGR